MLFAILLTRSTDGFVRLKSEFAQRVAVELAQEFAQVAVDEAEALRLSRKMG